LAPSESKLDQLYHRWKDFESLTLWRVQPFFDRYGVNLRWLVASATGIMAVIAIEPSFSGLIFEWSDQLQQFWFAHFGQLNGTQIEQVLVASHPGEVPAVQELLEQFPPLWGKLYFLEQE
jgi:hypothetical protein